MKTINYVLLILCGSPHNNPAEYGLNSKKINIANFALSSISAVYQLFTFYDVPVETE